MSSFQWDHMCPQNLKITRQQPPNHAHQQCLFPPKMTNQHQTGPKTLILPSHIMAPIVVAIIAWPSRCLRWILMGCHSQELGCHWGRRWGGMKSLKSWMRGYENWKKRTNRWGWYRRIIKMNKNKGKKVFFWNNLGCNFKLVQPDRAKILISSPFY